jgi:hypothetical protein
MLFEIQILHGQGTTRCDGINSHYVIPIIPVDNEICSK